MKEFFDRMHTLLGDDFGRYLDTVDKPPYHAVRVNTLKCSADKLRALCPFMGERTPFCKDGYYVTEEKLGKHPLHHAGAFYIQEPSAMSAVTVLGVEKGDRVLDLCAAPGGKSTQIAADLGSTGLLWANEVVRPRAHILLSNIERMGIANAVVSNMDPETLCTRLEGFFDKVLVDAPCSGEGMFRKDREAIEEWSVEHSLSCAVRQKAILESAKKAVRPGGVLVYSTCTFSVDENEGVVEAFLKDNPSFELVDTGESFGEAALCKARRIYPYHGGEGHFVAKFIKKDGDVAPAGVFRYEKPSRRDEFDIIAFVDELLRSNPFEHITVIDDRILELPDTELLPDMTGMNILRAGIKLGDFRRNRIEPHHNLATSLRPELFNRQLKLELSDELVNRYIRGEEISIDSWIRGYAVVSVEGIGLGLGKASDGRLKNKYPKGLRTLSWRI